ncbi:cysteine-rich receptor-like protein kinase 26, partial [Tanacetum coccineum]
MDLAFSIFQSAKASIELTQLLYVEATLIQMCVKAVSVTPWLRRENYESGSQTTTNDDKFNDDLRSLLDKLKEDAATGGALRKFASGNTTGPDSITIYAIMQCSPDISEQDCISCLDNIIVKHISGKMKGSVRGRALDTMCNFQYSERRFFNESIALVNPPPPSSSPSSSRSSSLPSPPPSSSLPSPL